MDVSLPIISYYVTSGKTDTWFVQYIADTILKASNVIYVTSSFTFKPLLYETGNWKKLHNEESRNLYVTVQWRGHVGSTKKLRKRLWAR